MTPGAAPRVSDAVLTHHLRVRGVGADDDRGALGARALLENALLDLRDARRELAGCRERARKLEALLRDFDKGYALAERVLGCMKEIVGTPPNRDDVAGETFDKWQRLTDAVCEADDFNVTIDAARRALAPPPEGTKP